jgi:SAM-dependent methyltransferase
MNLLKSVVYRHWQKFHGVRRLELRTLTRYLDLSDGERVLDVGSGKGAFCGVLRRAGHRVVGIDPSAPAVSIAKRHVDPRIPFVLGSGEDLAFAAGAFDRVISVCVLEHTGDDAKVLREVHRVLRPGGLFALSVDCLNSPYVSEAFRRRHASEYRCNQFYGDAKLRRLLSDAGFETLEMEYLFDSRLAVSILRFGSLFHYRSVFILLFPLIYPLLYLDHTLGGRRKSGMILAVKARKIGDSQSAR